MKVNFDSSLSKARKEYYIELVELRKKELREKMAILKERINSELAERNSDYVVKADFTSFTKESNLKVTGNNVDRECNCSLLWWRQSFITIVS